MMKLTRTWIDTTLNVEQRTALVDWLMERSLNPTAQLIRQGLEETLLGFDVEDLPSLNSLSVWKKKAWRFEIHRRELQAESQAAEIISHDIGQDLGLANKKLLEVEVFEQLRAMREGGEVDTDALHNMILSMTRASKSVQAARKTDAQIEILESKVRELEAKENAAAKISTDESLSESEKSAQMRALFGMGQ